MTMTSDECCPQFHPELWDNKTTIWQDKLFIKDSIPELFHMPWPPMVGKLMTRMWKRAEDAGAIPAKEDILCLAYDPSPWKSEFYLAVTKEIPGTENVRLSGEFMSKVFDGPYSAVPKWIKQFDAVLTGQQKKAQKYYFYYTSCPKCAKKWGHNYVVAFAQV